MLGGGRLSLNIASALISQILKLQDIETWADIRKHYLPLEYQTIYSVINKHTETYHSLPTFEELKLGIRDSVTLEKLSAIEVVDVQADPTLLLQYLKNEFTQSEILKDLDEYVEQSIAFEDAQEAVDHLQDIVMGIQDKVDLSDPAESMQRIALFDEDEVLENFLSLGFNDHYDNNVMRFRPQDFILVGGRRGAGKSITCVNIADTIYRRNQSSVYYTIEMPARSIMQRWAAVHTGVSHTRIKNKNLSIDDWDKLAEWWSGRFEDSQEHLHDYYEHRDWEKLQDNLKTSRHLKETNQVDIVYEPSLTLGKLKADLDQKISSGINLGIIVVDYINQLKRSNAPSRNGQYEWTEQIEIAKALKEIAQEYNVPVYSPYQIDATGEARFSKGILDSCDAAFIINTHNKEDGVMTFENVKMRDGPEDNFTSTMNWESLQIGPESAVNPDEAPEVEESGEESIHDYP